MFKLSDTIKSYASRNKLFILLLLLLMMLIILPIASDYLTYTHLSPMEVFLAIVLIINLNIFGNNKQHLIITSMLIVMTMIVLWFNAYLNSHKLIIVTLSLEIVYFIIATISIINHVLLYKRITTDRIYGAIVGYFLIGIIWALIYTLIETISPSSFYFSEALQASFSSSISYHSYMIYFLYYSFISISSMGYGDITPISDAARAFASLEGVIGQLYVAVLVSKLVSFQVMQSQK